MEPGSNVKIKLISEIIYKESVSGYFESEGHINAATVSVSQVVAERNVSLLFCGEMNDGDYNTL
jgi:hypothetical protein